MRCDSGRNPKALTRLFSLLLLQAKAKGKPRAKPAKKRRARSSSDEPSEVRVCTAAAQHQSFPASPRIRAPLTARAPPQDEGDDDAMEEDEEFAKMPLKKRMAMAGGGARGNAAPSSDDDDGAGAAGAASDSEDPYGSDFMGDEEDRERLANMNEFDRELVLAERAERRVEKTQRRELAAEMRSREAAQKRGKTRGRAPTADKAAKVAALQELAARRAGDKGAAREAASRRRAEDVKRRAEERAARAASDEDRSATDEEAAADEEEDEDDEAPATWADMQRLVLGRLQLEKWADKPFFDATLPGCFVRVGTSNGPDGQAKYRLAEVAAVLISEHHGKTLASYDFGPGGRRTSRWLLLRHGKHEQAFKMTLISNGAPTEPEIESWAHAAKMAGQRPLTRTQLATREAALAAAHAFRFTSADVARAVEAKRAAGHAPRNVAHEKEQILLRLEVAEQAGEEAEAESLRAMLAAADAQLQSVLPRGAAAMNNINKRNAVANVAILDEAGREAAATAQRVASSSAVDPFSRRPTRVTNYWQTGKKSVAPEAKPAEPAAAEAPAEPADELTKALAEEDAAAAAEQDTDSLRAAPGDEKERARAAEHAALWRPFDLTKCTGPRRIPVLRYWRGGEGAAEEALRAGKTLITVSEYYARRAGRQPAAAPR